MPHVTAPTWRDDHTLARIAQLRTDEEGYYDAPLVRKLEKELLDESKSSPEALGGETLRLLYKALADVHNYGPAKSIVMAGLKAGHDMTTEEGVSNWLKELGEGNPLARPSAKRKKGSSPRKRQP